MQVVNGLTGGCVAQLILLTPLLEKWLTWQERLLMSHEKKQPSHF
ncbi:hypothetical protein PMIT1303_00658 [Prochlorococcus sp. MIT 1303]|nr:hypothetical protein PMIT1303_00658 [Prochlorococcus sp. MIT 1303]